MAITLHDVANLAGVSTKTVSNVINGYPHISARTRERVQSAIVELGYRPNLSARSLRSGRTGQVSLVLPELSLAYFAELADAFIDQARRHDLVVLCELTGADRAREIDVLRSDRVTQTDGVVFSPLALGQDDADLLAVPYPLVILGERIFGGPTDHVTMQNVEAARAATEYLLSRGRRRIAVIGAHLGELIGSAGLRLRGYTQALQAAGIETDERLITYTTAWHHENGAQCMRELLAGGVVFDAVFGLNDALALGAMHVLQQAGRRVPQDVAVMGFDDLNESQYSRPGLTTVDAGRAEIAVTALERLMHRISHPVSPADPRVEIRAEFEIVERESA